MTMESRPFYEYPSSHAAIVTAIPQREYGSLTPAKAKKSWGNILKLGSKKDRDISPNTNNATIYGIPNSHPSVPIYATPSVDLSGTNRNYHAEYREKYGYNATYGRSSFQALGNISGMQYPKSIENEKHSQNSTMKYTDWFGSVTARRPPLRPQLPAFYPPQNNITSENGMGTWNQYVAVEQPVAIPMQVYTNVCMCPDQHLGTTKGRKKKKCKRCGMKPATLRNTTNVGQVKLRPSLSALIYQAPQMQPTNTSWGWPTREEQIYRQYTINDNQRPLSFPTFSPSRQRFSDEEDSTPQTPETVRSVRSFKSARSNDSNVTLTKENSSKSRKIPQPPKLPDRNIDKQHNKRSSIISGNTSAYELIEENDLSSDTDNLSDNAVDEKPEDKNLHQNNLSENKITNINDNKSEVSVITIGGDSTSFDNQSKKDTIRISPTSPHKIIIENPTSDFIANNNLKNISLNNIDEVNVMESCKINGIKINQNESQKTNSNNLDRKRNIYTKNHKNIKIGNNNYSSKSDRDISSYKPTQIPRLNKVKKSDSPKKSKSSPQSQSKNSSKNSTFLINNKIEEEERIDDKLKLQDSSELRNGGNTVRIAGQRMVILTSSTPPPETRLGPGFSSDEENIDENRDEVIDGYSNRLTFNDDTSISDYPISSPATTHDSDSDSNIDDQQKFTNYNKFYQTDIYNTRATSTIYEEDESSETACDTNENEFDKIDSYSKFPQKDDEISMSSSSNSTPDQQAIFQPSLSELLKVKSILKRPNSLDTSSETDSDFYLPTFGEFKQNQKKKKQVQFCASDDITVVEDLGETKGRKVSSIKSKSKSNKNVEINNYNLMSDLQDVYLRVESQKNKELLKTDSQNGYLQNILSDSTTDLRDEDSDLKHCEPKNNNISIHTNHGNLRGKQESSEFTNNLLKTEELSFEDLKLSSDSIPLCESQASSSSSNTQPTSQVKPSRKAPPPPKVKLSNVSRPTVPPPPPPPPMLSNPPSPPPPPLPSSPPPNELDINSRLTDGIPTSEYQRNFTNFPPAHPPPIPSSLPPPLPTSLPPPLPTFLPPPLPLSPPPLPDTLPPPLPESLPPPLPTSPPPFFDDTGDMAVIKRSSSSSHVVSNQTFSSFKLPVSVQSNLFSSSSQDCQSPIYSSSPILTNSPIDSYINHDRNSVINQTLKPKTNLDEIMSPSNHPIFYIDEEEKTATIRGRAKLSRSSLFDLSSESFSPTPTSISSPPKNPFIRQRPRSVSPWNEEHSIRQGRKCGRRLSFLNGLVINDDDDRLSDHIYEELNSSPSSPSHSSSTHEQLGKSMFDGASKYEILEYLKDARQRVAINAEDDADDIDDVLCIDNDLGQDYNGENNDEGEIEGLPGQPQEDNFQELTLRNNGARASNMSSNSDSSENSTLIRTDKEKLPSGDIERTDSGVGSETSKPNVLLRRTGKSCSTPVLNTIGGNKESDSPLCDDCETSVDTHVTNSGVVYAPLVCRRCSRRRQERKEILTEIMETEIKYGRDLRVMVEQFYRPMLVAGLLTKEQLSKIFLNVEELMEHNKQFSLQLKDAFEIALDQGDEDLLTVNVAKLFLQATPMLHAFQNYCVRQGGASLLLQSLEKEKELLRIFLKVSQMENTLLRRMNLHSFLMVPVQRVTKYPLLLSRLFKSTPITHSSREDCRKAREKIEIHLQHMNNETKDASPTKLWRRISMSVGSGTPLRRLSQTPPDQATTIKLRTFAFELLNWSVDEAYVVREGRLLTLPPDSNNWTRRGRSLKLAPSYVMLITLGKPNQLIEDAIPEDCLVTPRDLGIRDAAFVAFKDQKPSKSALAREPWVLSRCVVSWDAEGETDCYEIHDLNSKDTYIFKDRDSASTEEWFRLIQFHALSVGSWRKRRPALANIMINGMHRTY